MSARPALRGLLLVALTAPQALAAEPARRPRCQGAYADALAAMAPEARARESSAAAGWVHCLRAIAVYEHLSYGAGGRIRRQYYRKVRHGTGFVYRRDGDRSLVATNEHVVDFPEVTRSDQDVEGVPPGSRRVRALVKIVESEADPDTADQPVLEPIVTDEALDLAVLAARRPLRVAPYRLGRSGDLRVGDLVLVRGFPLGAFPAANVGRVIGVGQRDLERGWDHVDFAVDALLNPGGSGSPVLAVSCRTGEPEIVGVYHAGYKGAQGLHVVVGMDDLRASLNRLEAAVRPVADRAEPAPDRVALRSALARGPVLMPFGGRVVRAEVDRAGVRFAVLDGAFPLSARVDLALVDRGDPPPRETAALLVPSLAGSAEIPWAALAGDSADRARELREGLWRQLAAVLRYRAAEAGGDGPVAESVCVRIAGRLRDREEEQGDLLAALLADSDHLASLTKGESRAASSDPARGGMTFRPEAP
jgi:S1-C subfamily serine protease